MAICWLCLSLASDLSAQVSESFSYQAHLLESGEPADGYYDLRVVVYDEEIGGSQLGSIITNQYVVVENGVLNTALDLGSELLTGRELWLEIGVRNSEGALPFTTLAPRQTLLATPYATYSATAQSASHAITSDTAAHALSADQATESITADQATRAATADRATTAESVDWSSVTHLPDGFADQIDDDTTYSAGPGLNLIDTVFSIASQGVGSNELADASITPEKLVDGVVTTSALADQSVTPTKINIESAQAGHSLIFDGETLAWTNVSWVDLSAVPAGLSDGVDDDTQYEAGPGLVLQATEFAIDPEGLGTEFLADGSVTDTKLAPNAIATVHLQNAAVTPDKVAPASAAPGQALVFDGAGVVWTNVDWGSLTRMPEGFLDGVDNDTIYQAGEGLRLEEPLFSVEFSGSGTNLSAARSDHQHDLSFLDGQLLDAQLSTNVALLNADLVFTGTNYFQGPVTLENETNWLSGTFVGDGAGLTNLQGTLLNPGTVGTTALADNAITSEKLAEATVSARELQADAVTSDAILDATITESDLADGSVTTLKIAEHSISNIRLQTNAVTTDKILDATITESDLADGSVTALKIAEHSISNIRLQTNAVTTDTILDATITESDLADGSVTALKIADDSVDSRRVQDGSLLPEDLNLNGFSPLFWRTDGNTGTVAGLHFLGTLDQQPLELRVGGLSALRISPNDTNGVNWVAGSSGNHIATNVVGATVGGGGFLDYLGTPHTNQIAGDFSTISGGSRNQIEETAQWSSIAGGMENRVGINAQWSVVSGGQSNELGRDADFTVITGGRDNRIMSTASGSLIGGGAENLIDTNATYGVISGGYHNTINTNSLSSVIPGGMSNYVSAAHAFAAGYRARVEHDGSFVWADATDADMPTSNTNEFTIRASGGVRMFSDGAASSGVSLAPGSGTWATLSDRASKDNFSSVPPEQILEKLIEIPVTTWNYRTESPRIRHLGPVAQEFHAAFGLGDDPRRITTVDADGVALAAIQGLHSKLTTQLRARDQEIAALREQLQAINERLNQVMVQLNTAPNAHRLRVTNP